MLNLNLTNLWKIPQCVIELINWLIGNGDVKIIVFNQNFGMDPKIFLSVQLLVGNRFQREVTPRNNHHIKPARNCCNLYVFNVQ